MPHTYRRQGMIHDAFDKEFLSNVVGKQVWHHGPAMPGLAGSRPVAE